MTTRLRVMLVDDHAIVREGYRRLLELEPGIEVVGERADAESALTALAALASAAVPASPVERERGALVVVLDLSMPGRGGLDLLQRVAGRWPGVHVLVFSMHDHPALVAQALAAGAAGYVTKTAPPDRLVDAVRRVAAGETPVLSDDVAATLALARASSPAPHETLSAREFGVLHLLVGGLAVDAIAAHLSLSPKTVSNLQTAIRTKLRVTTAVELLRYAHEHRLVVEGGRPAAAAGASFRIGATQE